MEEIREKIERMKIKAEAILNENKKAFLINSADTYFFCDIISFNDNKIIVKPFKGNNINVEIEIYWADIIKLEEYREMEE